MLQAKQYQAIEWMARGLSMQGVAERIGASERSVRRWRDDPEFAAELRDAIQGQREDIAMRQCIRTKESQWLGAQATDRLHKLMKDGDTRVAARACHIALNHEHKSVQATLSSRRLQVAQPDSGAVQLPSIVPADASAMENAPATAPSVARAASAVGCPCDAEGESVHHSGIASVSNNKNGSNPTQSAPTVPDTAPSAHGHANSNHSDFAQPTAKAARATPVPAVPSFLPGAQVQEKPALKPDRTGQNRTFFPDAKGLSVSGQQHNSEQHRTSSAFTSTKESRLGTPAPQDKPYPRTPDEFAEEIRELELLLQDAQSEGDAEGVQELECLIAESLKLGRACVARAASAVGCAKSDSSEFACPCDAEGESVHPSGIASVANGKSGSNPEKGHQPGPIPSASAHGQPTAKAARATPPPSAADAA